MNPVVLTLGAKKRVKYEEGRIFPSTTHLISIFFTVLNNRRHWTSLDLRLRCESYRYKNSYNKVGLGKYEFWKGKP